VIVPGGDVGAVAAPLAIIAVALWLTSRKYDVRLALGLSGLALFALSGRVAPFVGYLARELANPATVVPIGAAMGFSYVLRETGCDVHLIQLLLRPLRRVRPMLVPGGVLAGYVVNSTLVSQTSAAAVLGPILIPLLRAGGVPAGTAGAVLLMGCSIGELFNPGAVEVVTLSDLTKLGPGRVVTAIAPWNLMASGVALVVFWGLDLWRRRRRGAGAASGAVPDEGPIHPEPPPTFRIHPLKAVVPVIPLAILFVSPRFVILDPAVFPRLTEPASILGAMLVGVVAAGLAAPSRADRLAHAFFDGAGYAYLHVISLIVTATAFTEGVKASGLIDRLIAALAGRPEAALAVAALLPWGMARVCGSGIAPAVAVMRALVPEAARLGLDPLRLGAVASMAAHFGRTMSPAAAVVAMSSSLAGVDRDEILPRVGWPLMVGLGALPLAAWIA
jgi:DcuC family C4-dicarboxylate transporter